MSKSAEDSSTAGAGAIGVVGGVVVVIMIGSVVGDNVAIGVGIASRCS